MAGRLSLPVHGHATGRYPEALVQMINIKNSITIYQPVGLVFDFMSTPGNNFQWQYGTLESYPLADGTDDDGSRFRSIGHLMGRRNIITFKVTENIPGKKYDFKSLSGPLQLYTSYTFESDKGGTKVNISIQANVVNYIQENEAVLERTIGKQLKDDLAMLKKILEAR